VSPCTCTCSPLTQPPPLGTVLFLVRPPRVRDARGNDNVRRTKIVATIGPASGSQQVLEELIRAGMSVARLNFSHGTHESHAADYAAIRAASETTGTPVAVLADLQGPKIRVGSLAGGRMDLPPGGQVTITTRELVGEGGVIPTTYAALPGDVSPGDRILLADGEFELKVLEVSGTDVRCKVLVGGPLGEHQGINLPGVPVSAPSLTEKDLADLEFALDLGVDYIAQSFVRTVDDVLALKRAMGDHGRVVPVVAKIEKPEAVGNLDMILRAVEALMIARGDLGVEMPLDEVPVLQKRIIAQAHRRSVPVITATQMLQSMVDNPRPTRAEASDVANAIFDETDAVMLSAETAVGKHPVETVRVMDRIARTAEASALRRRPYVEELSYSTFAFPNTIAHTACRAAHESGARGIVVFSRSGNSARLTSMYRPAHPVIAVTPDVRSLRRMALYWGIKPMLSEELQTGTGMVARAETAASLIPGCVPGDTIVVTSGTALGDESITNSLRFQVVKVRGPGREDEPESDAQVREDPVDIDPLSCIACGACVSSCRRGVLELAGRSARVAEDRGAWCDRGGDCERVCPTGAIAVRRQALPLSSERPDRKEEHD